MPEKASREVFSDKYVSFAAESLLENAREDFSGINFGEDFYRSLLKVFPKSSQCRKKSTFNTFEIDFI